MNAAHSIYRPRVLYPKRHCAQDSNLTESKGSSMTLHPFKLAAYAALAHIAMISSAVAQGNAPVPAQEITRAGTQASTTGPADWFTGRVRVDPVWAADANINTSGAWVTFEPGARSAWHSHPAGQRLVVLSG